MIHRSYRRGTKLTPSLLKDLERDLCDRVWGVWEDIHAIVSAAKMPGYHAILFKHPVKEPSIEICDNISELLKKISEKVSTERFS